MAIAKPIASTLALYSPQTTKRGAWYGVMDRKPERLTRSSRVLAGLIQQVAGAMIGDVGCRGE